jgi:ankyrin repeat protein
MASLGGRADVARLLLDRGAEVDQARDDGKAALQAASQQGHVDVAQVLLDRGRKLTTLLAPRLHCNSHVALSARLCESQYQAPTNPACLLVCLLNCCLL